MSKWTKVGLSFALMMAGGVGICLLCGLPFAQIAKGAAFVASYLAIVGGMTAWPITRPVSVRPRCKSGLEGVRNDGRSSRRTTEWRQSE